MFTDACEQRRSNSVLTRLRLKEEKMLHEATRNLRVNLFVVFRVMRVDSSSRVPIS